MNHEEIIESIEDDCPNWCFHSENKAVGDVQLRHDGWLDPDAHYYTLFVDVGHDLDNEPGFEENFRDSIVQIALGDPAVVEVWDGDRGDWELQVDPTVDFDSRRLISQLVETLFEGSALDDLLVHLQNRFTE